MILRPHERTAIFVDGANFTYAARNIGLVVDFEKLLAQFREHSGLVAAHYFTSVRPGPEGDGLVRWLHHLGRTGWRVFTKEVDETPTEAGGVRMRDRSDVALAVAMVTQAPRLDHIVLLSGDSDFCPAVSAAQAAGARVSVVSTRGGSQGRRSVSEDLIVEADDFADLIDLAPHIRKDMAEAA